VQVQIIILSPRALIVTTRASISLFSRAGRSAAAASSLNPKGDVVPLEFFPSACLRNVCTEVLPGHGQALCASLLATAAAHEALGLAAPQIGGDCRIFSLRVPVGWTAAAARRATLKRSRHASFIACVNPEIVTRSSETVPGLEACLSLPDAPPSLVRRAAQVRVRFTDGSTGLRVEHDLDGLPAAVFQHELDHLDGILITDLVSAAEPLAGAAFDDAVDAFQESLESFYHVRV
jgi:peptide deformylase